MTNSVTSSTSSHTTVNIEGVGAVRIRRRDGKQIQVSEAAKVALKQLIQASRTSGASKFHIVMKLTPQGGITIPGASSSQAKQAACRVWAELHTPQELSKQNLMNQKSFRDSIPKLRQLQIKAQPTTNASVTKWSWTRGFGYGLTAFGNFLIRVFGKNYSEILTTTTTRPNKLLLGPMPNKIGNGAQYLKRDSTHLSILTCQEDAETQSHGFAQPYTHTDWEVLGRDYTHKQLSLEDHTFMLADQMSEAADFIHQQLQQGDVYVHCRAGVGRSATAIAAYLIKYEGKTVVEAINLIKSKRDKATISNKIPGLKAFCYYLEETDQLPSRKAVPDLLTGLENEPYRSKEAKAMAKLQKQAKKGMPSAQLLQASLLPSTTPSATPPTSGPAP